ncbi:MAG: EAL domain-containing protein [Sphingomonadaceae bacterium]
MGEKARPRAHAGDGETRARERRESDGNGRRKGRRDKGAPVAPGSETSLGKDGVPVRTLISEHWFHTAGGFAVIIATALGVTGSIPPIASLALFIASLGVIAGAPWIRKHERGLEDSSFKSFALMIGATALPTALFALGLVLWSSARAPFEPHHLIGALVAVSSLTTITSQGRLPTMLTSLLAAWLALGAQANLVFTLAVTVFGLGAGFWLTKIHLQQTKARRARASRIARVQERAEEMLSDYEKSGQGWFWETDRRGNVSYVSAHIARLLGKPAEELVGTAFLEMFRLDAQEKESERTLNFHLSTRSSFQDLAVQAATREQEERWWSVSGRPVLDKFNNFLGFRGWGSDLTEARRSQRHVTELARYDSLTKLANRFQMSEWLEKILSSPQEERRACAVFLLDLDRFKQVNDTMGHPAGDALLRQVADRLRTAVGESGSVGRLGGDEFQVILPGRHKPYPLAHLATRIIESLSQPYSIEGNRVIIGASVGISVCPDHGSTSEELIRNADLALYAAKDGGRGRYHFYANDLHSEAEERRQLEQDLRDAITNGELELHYQPQVATMSEKISGFEALVRWKHPVKGSLSPAKFIPIAEDTGLIAPLGEWALRTACDQLAKWPESVRIAVNVSPLQFANPALPSIVTNAIANAGIDPKRLELEITESVFLNDDTQTEQMFASLKGIGVRLALDDFGTGYSSLGYLKKAPFDKIKIDQSFVRGATMSGTRNGAIIASIVSLAESLGMETIAEGVETLDELDLIRSLGCSHIQGYIYEKPLAPAAANARLEAGLEAIARGPRSARAPRQTMLRKVLVEHGANRYQGTIRNISANGAMVEGLWNVPAGTQFKLHLSKDFAINVTARWSKEDRMGVEFAEELELDDAGSVKFTRPRGAITQPADQTLLRKAG